MAKNFIQPGDTLELTAPSGGVESGSGYVIESLFVVALGDADEDELFRGSVCGVWELPKAATVTPAEGEKAYFKSADGTITNASAQGLYPIGVFTADAEAADATVMVRLDGVSVTAVPAP